MIWYMAIMTIKSTYALDVETVRKLEEMAREWNVSKSEALRRAIRAAAAQKPPRGQDAVDALERLQGALGLTASRAKAWSRRAHAERRATSERAEARER